MEERRENTPSLRDTPLQRGMKREEEREMRIFNKSDYRNELRKDLFNLFDYDDNKAYRQIGEILSKYSVHPIEEVKGTFLIRLTLIPFYICVCIFYIMTPLNYLITGKTYYSEDQFKWMDKWQQKLLEEKRSER